MTNRTVEIDLVASEFEWEYLPGQPTRVWGYNRQVPGPTIEANAGDTLVVRLHNQLPEPTTIHWHGLRIPAPMDGTEDTQPTVQPGAVFEYRFVLPDAGTFWYHPHTNETVQLERGLYGALVVRDPHEELVVDEDRTFVLRDVKLDRHAQIAKFGGFGQRHNGRKGNVLLVNGKPQPMQTVRAGQFERWRFINTASGRYFRLTLGGREFRIIGTDGGAIEAPVFATEVSLAPADRIEILAGPFGEGDTVQICDDRTTIAVVEVITRTASRAHIPARLRTIEPIAPFDTEPTRKLKLFAMPSRQVIDFTVNGQAHLHDQPVRLGEVQVWEIVNLTPMHHPFHLHGYFFQVLSVNGKEPPYRSWEDTVDVPPLGRVRIAWKPEDRAGRWMYHCHILEHHAAGMMAHFETVEGSDPDVR